MLVENYILVNSFPIASGTLNNNHNYIAYKCMRGDMSVGVDVINLAHMPGKYNPDDVLSNTIPPPVSLYLHGLVIGLIMFQT